MKRTLHSILLLVIAGSYIACSATQKYATGDRTGGSGAINYSLIYVIHGDADYLYHDAEGKALQADEQVLAEAKKLARRAKTGEVFIFHLRPERKIMWLFPKKDRHFYYYRNGRLEHRTAYSPEPNSGVFFQESHLYKQFKYSENDNSDAKNLFLFFGHEIPYRNGTGYHQSFSEFPVNVSAFTGGIKSFTDYRRYFDLTLLSTCNNGSPDMVYAMESLTKNLLASPQNLHLSHMNTERLSLLESNPGIRPEDLARELASDTYDYLSTFLQTVIALTHYDMEEVKNYSRQADSLYRKYLSENETAKPGADNIDCTNLSIFKKGPDFSEGITTWYRPPSFGIRAGEEQHSGWGCKPRIPEN